ncbi:MAG: 16S rRNA (adenine(1518)-N(6)/adenine(1519)-N(6))-dimethyltransferase RsmA [Patescibacteria group bacterium]
MGKFLAKKSLGQNFLKNKEIVKKIIESADLSAEDVVLEIGPGKGVLTEELVKVAKKVIAVEIDKNLAEILRNKFKGNEKVGIINKDILKIKLIDLISNKVPNSKSQNTKYNILDTKYKLVANLPYYITSPIIRMFLESDLPPREMILMVQKEVAERIVAKPEEMSILAVSVQYYAQPELLFYVNKENFDPVPEVDSAVIRISVNSEQRTVNSEKSSDFFRVVRAGFCAKRKMLANNLANSFHLDKKKVEEKLKAAGISPTARAQELSVEDWKKLVRLIA